MNFKKIEQFIKKIDATSEDARNNSLIEAYNLFKGFNATKNINITIDVLTNKIKSSNLDSNTVIELCQGKSYLKKEDLIIQLGHSYNYIRVTPKKILILSFWESPNYDSIQFLIESNFTDPNDDTVNIHLTISGKEDEHLNINQHLVIWVLVNNIQYA